MTSQTCNGMVIYKNELIKCLYSTNNLFCEHHIHQYRFEKPNECMVCLDCISSETEIPLNCGHWVHKECLKKSNQTRCPLCRQEMNNFEIEYVFDTNNYINTNVFQSVSLNYENEMQIINDFELNFIIFMNELPRNLSSVSNVMGLNLRLNQFISEILGSNIEPITITTISRELLDEIEYEHLAFALYNIETTGEYENYLNPICEYLKLKIIDIYNSIINDV